MRIPSYVQPVLGTASIIFRLHIPEHLRASTGNRSNIRKSLRTGNAQEAIRLARGLAAQYHSAFVSNDQHTMTVKPTPDDTHLIAEIDLSKGVFKLDYDQSNPDEVSNAERILKILEARHNAPVSHQTAIAAPIPALAPTPKNSSGVTFSKPSPPLFKTPPKSNRGNAHPKKAGIRNPQLENGRPILTRGYITLAISIWPTSRPI